MSDIIIPAHNEEETIYDIVRAAVASRVGHVFVVADNCNDRTASLANQAGASTLLVTVNDKGHAVAAGVKHVKTPRVILFDGDLTGVEPEHFEQLDNFDDGMTVGIRGASYEKFKSRNLRPDWSIGGERCLPTETLMRTKLEDAGYKLEMRINRRAKLEGIDSRWTWLDGVGHRTDYEKTSLSSIAHDIKRWKDVAFGYMGG
jgi:glycosyltransferase involved in cell wall biosynthesis